MTRVDFYVVAGNRNVHDRTLCRIVEKAWQHGHHVYVQCADPDSARTFDDLLWQFQDTSFVPHELDGDACPDTAVVVGTGADDAVACDVLVNLTTAVPSCASRYARVVESAGHDEDSRRAARERYRYYQERGFPLHTHKLAR